METAEIHTEIPEKGDLETAYQRIRPYVHNTPVLTSRAINSITGADIHFKCENFQRVGAFKFRGAINRVLSLSQKEADRGVVTHSSGNHGQALALAARIRGIRADIVMPENSPAVKIAGVEGYGGKITFCAPTQEARRLAAAAIVSDSGALHIHSCDDPGIVAGQASCAREVFETGLNPDIIMTPVGGGGMLSGTSLTVSCYYPDTVVMGAEPLAANTTTRSLAADRIVPSSNPKSLADGLLTTLGDINFAIIRKHVNKILCCSEASIIEAMHLIWERMKIVVEPSGAVPLATVLDNPQEFSGKKVVLVITGGNVDIGKFPQK